MKNIGQIIKKEMDKIFKFPRMIFSTLVLPGLLIFGIYTFMGQSAQSESMKTVDYNSKIILVNAPDSFESYLEQYIAVQAEAGNPMFIDYQNAVEPIDELKIKIRSGSIDTVIEFSKDFNAFTDTALVNIYSNNGINNSLAAKQKINLILDSYKTSVLLKDINTNAFHLEEINATDDEKNVGMVLAMLLPMFIMTFVFAGALGVGSDAIAGEKERGTLATLLMAPIKKTEIILGKTISTAMIAIMSALSSFIGVVASLPFAKAMFPIESGVNYSIYIYLQLIVVLILLGMLSSALILIASTFAKSTKEATTYAMPIYIVAILVATVSMFSTELPNNLALYFIPIYNITLVLKGVFSFQLENTQFLIAIFSTTVYILIVTFILIKMFKSEKVLFNK
jgi:sodium transport system permease protein